MKELLEKFKENNPKRLEFIGWSDTYLSYAIIAIDGKKHKIDKDTKELVPTTVKVKRVSNKPLAQKQYYLMNKWLGNSVEHPSNSTVTVKEKIEDCLEYGFEDFDKIAEICNTVPGYVKKVKTGSW